MINYIVMPLSVTDKEAFLEASSDELRTLVALIECGGKTDSADALAKKVGVSKARLLSSLVFWQEAGVIRQGNSDAPTITEEFEYRLRTGEIVEEASVDVAKSIRNSALKDMISECATLMQRSALNTTEIKNLTALHEQYALSTEYIITLAGFLSDGGEVKLTVTKLVNKAISLVEKEIDTQEELEAYIAKSQSMGVAEKAFRQIFGIYDRALSKSEKEAFRKWGEDFGYYTEIVGEAYDIAVSHGVRNLVSYVNKLLCAWHEAGCRTLNECREKYESDEREKALSRQTKKSTEPKKKTEEERHGAFDVNDAFMKALERSYGNDDKK